MLNLWGRGAIREFGEVRKVNVEGGDHHKVETIIFSQRVDPFLLKEVEDSFLIWKEIALSNHISSLVKIAQLFPAAEQMGGC